VRRWVAGLGAPAGDIDDVTQEVFIIVRRKLSGFDSKNVAGWLFRIAERTARDFRQKAWFRRALPYQRAEQSPSGSSNRDQASLYEAREALRRVEEALAGMSEKRRRAFVLFAFHGYSGEEIAALDDVPLATVWSRIHQARKELSRTLGAGQDGFLRGTTQGYDAEPSTHTLEAVAAVRAVAAATDPGSERER
jgi:RNA polymerase sigma-70 factor (ECF subfamily)